MRYDVIVIGGGAAGLFCAATAGKRGRRVLVLEHNPRVGEKIKISGGGRCNFTNLRAGPENYLSANPAFCRSALARFTPADFVSLVDQHGISHHEKKLGQLFCTASSGEIIRMLLDECSAARVEIRCGCRVQEVRTGFEVRTDKEEYCCESLVLATGGLSFAKLGATDFGHRVARQFGMGVTELRPGLVPLTLEERALRVFAPVSGVSLPVRVKNRSGLFEESVLVTHRGLSGPAILQISSYWRPGDRPAVDLLPDKTVSFQKGGMTAAGILSEFWPRRFAEAWCSLYAPGKPPGQWSEAERREVGERLHAWRVEIAGTEGYPKAEVTLGGVDTAGLSSKTMESRTVRGLYFIGEVVDVTGWLGGYNFQWAWASAHAAGQFV